MNVKWIRSVPQYEKLDLEIILAILEKDLDDLVTFSQVILKSGP